MTDREEELKERLFRSAQHALTDAEILELLLMYAIAADNAKNLAERLMIEFRSLREVLNASTVELTQVEGLDSKTAGLIRVAAQLVSRCGEADGHEKDIFANSKEVERYLLSRFSGMKEEKALAVFFNDQGVILGQDFLGAGTVDHMVLFPRQIMERALMYNATSLIIAHNHPHGPPLPSMRDREEAERLRDILRPFEIVVKDSIVVGRNRCFSIFKNTPL
ncbi:MAG: RadC family protein [Desulfomonile tiedjei]|uniref:RadC family protein n=1 Tax=Desulfomonile tiedjei TaxID=2358 RepID=A0A9D6V4D8_9BACT|nr:RadC family protein [Desulfomonile tiedjei]